MMTRHKRFLSLGIGFGLLAVAAQTQIAPRMAHNSARTVSNGLTMNGLSMNGEAINRSTDRHPDWINPATTEARLNHHIVESVRLNSGQLISQLSE